MKPDWFIRHEQRETLFALQEEQCKRAFRIFAITLALTHLRAFLHFVQHQALQLVLKLKLILAAASDHSLVHHQLIERQDRQKRPRTPWPRPLALWPAAPQLAPPA